MIHFSLRCRPAGHSFDGWFRSNDDFEKQAKSGLVECPACGSGAVEKALMRPAIAKGGGARTEPMRQGTDEGAALAPASAGGAPAAPAAAEPPQALAHLPEPSPEVVKAIAALQEISRTVRAKADNVGKTFAEEARRIHYGESEARQIYGEASKKDVEGLREEGITALPLMPLPEDGQ
ncbi:DUF1178 family protein [Jiella mangrovi]|uniref:DUF1178 family protein n=1 Tax=Jiella mangrovi TaxID=2821407 RepID=A0ABS4BLW7_9HYPH|nr:DUF1178 family protein [Jiella mangrovi]MBP0617179.1 DUF1178 family protein [Jiella mangrovi]